MIVYLLSSSKALPTSISIFLYLHYVLPSTVIHTVPSLPITFLLILLKNTASSPVQALSLSHHSDLKFNLLLCTRSRSTIFLNETATVPLHLRLTGGLTNYAQTMNFPNIHSRLCLFVLNCSFALNICCLIVPARVCVCDSRR